MKIYNSSNSENRSIIGYKCDNCDITEAGDTVPNDFIEEQSSHYCDECQVSCTVCNRVFSIKYGVDWFKNSRCENCQEERK